jgi:hypothetical protein
MYSPKSRQESLVDMKDLDIRVIKDYQNLERMKYYGGIEKYYGKICSIWMGFDFCSCTCVVEGGM